MEVRDRGKPAWLNPEHPNFERWERSRELSEERGNFVLSIVRKYIKCENLNILDLGSGEGGTSSILSANNFLVSLDLSFERLQRQKARKNILRLVRGDVMHLPFKNNFFDLIILQDVIEHVPSPSLLIENISRILKPEGIVYLSTPNKLSGFNLIADPHWGMPLISVLKRNMIKKYFLRYFRKNEYLRNDVAQLLSFGEIEKLLKGRFALRLNTRHSVIRLFAGDRGIVWSNFHLTVIKLLKKFHLDKPIIKLANDDAGLLNKYFNPTFYLILKPLGMMIDD